MNLLNRWNFYLFILISFPFLIGSSNKIIDGNNDRFSLFNYSVFTPGSDVRINLYSSADENNNYKFRLFRITDPVAFFTKLNWENVRYNFDVWGEDRDFLLKYSKQVKEWTTQVKSSVNYWAGKNLDIGVIDSPGYYILQALNGKQVAYCGIEVANLVMVYKNSGSQLLAFVANSSSGNIIKKTSFDLFSDNNLLDNKKSGSDGIVLFNLDDSLAASKGRMLLIAKTDSGTVLSDPYYFFRGAEDRYTAYIYTNQPVYRPGQRVFFKAMMREKKENSFSNLPGEEFSVKIKSSKNKDVYSQDLKTNEAGSLSGSFVLDEDADLGNYSIQIVKNSMTYYGSFEVEEYKKPEYLVKVQTDKPQFSGGDTLKADISADYYFGSPVMNAKVNIKVYRRQYWKPWWYWSDYAWFYKSYSGRIGHFSRDELISEQNGMLNKNGKFNYNYTVPKDLDNDYIYIISADITDNSRNTVSGQTEVYLTRGSFSVSTSPDRFFLPLGMVVGLRVNTADFLNRPVKTGFKIIVEYPAQLRNGYTAHIIPDTLYGSTDQLGKALISYMPRILASGSYNYTVYAKDSVGRIISAKSSFFVGKVNDYYFGRLNSGLEIVTDKETYEKGDSLTAFIFFPQNNMDVLISYETNDILNFKVFHVNENNLTLKLKLTDKFSPSFNIDVTYIKDNQLNHASKLVGVLDKDKFLTITLTPSAKINKPGNKIHYDISVTDNKNNPVKNADLSMGVVDESVYAIKEDETPDIKSFFYAPMFSYIPTYSSFQNAFFNGTSRKAVLPDTKANFHDLSPEGSGNLSGKLITKKNSVKFTNIYVILSGDDFYYQVKTDTNGNYLFKNIKTGYYDLITFLDDGEFITGKNILVTTNTNRDINLGDYSNINTFVNNLPFMREDGILARAAVVNTNIQTMMIKSSEAIHDKQSFVQPQLRSKFADAAFWMPDIITDSYGKATVSFNLPDNLTTWRATVRGITLNTLVGQDTNKIISRKNLLVRLETPRFFGEGDEAVISTIVHNYLSTEKMVKISFNPGILSLLDSRINQPGYDNKNNGKKHGPYLILLKKNSEIRIDWRVKVTEPIGNAGIEASALTDEESDAVKLSVPIRPNGIKITRPVVTDYSGINGEKTVDFEIPRGIDMRCATLSISAAPSIAASMLKSLDDLAGYPYGCVEQTMSRFLPTITVANTFKSLHAPLKAATLENLPKMVEAGLKRLYGFQHNDGGWGWWTNDKTNPYMTAYVVYGLTLAGESGYKIDSTVYRDGLVNLNDQVKNGINENFTTQAFMIYAYTTAIKKTDSAKVYLEKIKTLLSKNPNPYALSLLALSLKNLGYDDNLKTVIKKLADSAIHEGDYTYWGGKTWHYTWQDDKVQTTAFVLKALLLENNNRNLITSAVRWLLLQKQGFSWHSTQETATVIFALTDYLKNSGELNPDFNLSVYVNNKKIIEKSYTKNDVFGDQHSLNIAWGNDMILRHGRNIVKVVKKGTGTVYISGVSRYYSNNYSVENKNSEFKVLREFYKLVPEDRGDGIVYLKRKLGSEIKSGDILLVKTHIETKQKDLKYFILEDMLPSGFEVIKDQTKFPIENEEKYSGAKYGYGIWPWFYADREYRDDRVSFFVTYVNQQMDFSYIIRAEIPGKYNISPAEGYLMYYPETAGNSKDYKINVVE